jgi:hypothetical protein
MGVKVTNNAFGILASAITNVSTTITLSSGDGAKFPVLASGDFFFGTLINTANELEIVKVTARSTNTLTVIRGQDGTTARAYSAGDRFELRPTAAMFEAFTQAESISYDNTASGISANNVQTAIDSSKTLIDTKQATLVSGTNIKTVGGQTILGGGDLALPPNTYAGYGYELYRIAGTYTWDVPSGVTQAKVTVFAAGGGGSNGGFGGHGGMAVAIVDLTLSSYTVTVGAGGTGRGIAKAPAGGPSSFGSLITTTGGTGANAYTAGASGTSTVSGGTNLRSSTNAGSILQRTIPYFNGTTKGAGTGGVVSWTATGPYFPGCAGTGTNIGAVNGLVLIEW